MAMLLIKGSSTRSSSLSSPLVSTTVVPTKNALMSIRNISRPPFIDTTDHYYKKESEAFLAENIVSEYLKAEDMLREEDRVEPYLHTKTRKELITKCEHVLIREHAERMWDDFQKLLDYDQDEDLQRMYALPSRITEGLEPLRKRFENHVKNPGLSAVSKLVGAGNETADALDPGIYVDTLLEVHRKNSEMVSRSFKSEAGFAASLNKACREFVNRNAATGSSSTKSPELIANHADLLLRKNNKMAEEEDLESALNCVMILFKYPGDKDVFQTIYTTKLSKRLTCIGLSFGSRTCHRTFQNVARARAQNYGSEL